MDASTRSVAVVGATGRTGRFVVADLLRRGITPIAIARNAAALKAEDFDQKVIRRQAAVDDAGSLDRALVGAHAVINTADPFVDTAEAVASAALRARIHYIDVSAEQGSPTKLFEKFDGPARKAGLVFLPAMAFFGGLSDLMVTALLKDWDAVDRIETFIGFDKWHPTQGTRNTIERKVVGNLVRREAHLGAGDARREKLAFRGPDRRAHRARDSVQRDRAAGTAREDRRAPQLRHRVAIADVLNPSTPPPKAADAMGRSSQNFVVEVVVTRGDEQRRALTRGRDGYATTAPLTGEAVERLLKGQFRSAGAKAPGEIFDAEGLLRALEPDHATFEVVKTA
jgi:short subunit dehydrogenase-like uncharacterized protein